MAAAKDNAVSGFGDSSVLGSIGLYANSAVLISILCAGIFRDGTRFPPLAPLVFPTWESPGCSWCESHFGHYQESAWLRERADVTKTGNLSVENFEAWVGRAYCAGTPCWPARYTGSAKRKVSRWPFSRVTAADAALFSGALPRVNRLDVRMGRAFPPISTESRTRRSDPWPPFLEGTRADSTRPAAAAPWGTTVFPSMTTASDTVASKAKPASGSTAVIGEVRRTVTCVPAGNSGSRNGRPASVLDSEAGAVDGSEPGESRRLTAGREHAASDTSASATQFAPRLRCRGGSRLCLLNRNIILWYPVYEK